MSLSPSSKMVLKYVDDAIGMLALLVDDVNGDVRIGATQKAVIFAIIAPADAAVRAARRSFEIILRGLDDEG